MPNADHAQRITDTVHRYLRLVADGSADDIADLYAEDATVEDPVGGEIHIGRRAIHGFYSAVDNVQRECELVTLRVCGNEAAFHFRLTVALPSQGAEHRMVIEPIDVMVFDDEGKVAAMKAYWSPADVRQL
ncbi:steroid delta-isomerase [Mycobacterium bohemicum DSM 44277]|uniref:Steroid delta-isomerase n=2 Tax=Mycobacterium bohemicum TaxID=56425 RepID=A0A1X1R775_MYCBE|nr:nuclear transport factor 2 family protein [Mycobacterium bohemicum]MCV6970815.1 nuclear transport factor 2 family protein [Mycobacterium bohemicum]ORV00722.1 steroid delta-isomerase [Mycobacterium bohemicum]CPR09031.1 steroid delta-isomerase [Mycobacterium bohemicum DSM 44277]